MEQKTGYQILVISPNHNSSLSNLKMVCRLQEKDFVGCLFVLSSWDLTVQLSREWRELTEFIYLSLRLRGQWQRRSSYRGKGSSSGARRPTLELVLKLILTSPFLRYALGGWLGCNICHPTELNWLGPCVPSWSCTLGQRGPLSPKEENCSSVKDLGVAEDSC